MVCGPGNLCLHLTVTGRIYTVNGDESSENHLPRRQDIRYRMEVPVFGILVWYCMCCSGKTGFRKRADSSAADAADVLNENTRGKVARNCLKHSRMDVRYCIIVVVQSPASFLETSAQSLALRNSRKCDRCIIPLRRLGVIPFKETIP